MRVHTYASASEDYAFRLKQETLFKPVLAGQRDSAACGNDAVPRQGFGAV
jgi:hypothetical protein